MLLLLLALQDSMSSWPASQAVTAHPQEVHLRNVKQLTFGGQNAEAYWSTDGKRIVFQSRQPQYPDEQVFVMNADGTGKRLVSTGKGRCTCGYFSPDGKFIYFSSTHAKNEGAQAPIDMSKGYVWKVNPEFSLWRADKNSKLERVLEKNTYVAETTIAPNGRYMTFTSDYEGDLEIYRSDLRGKNVRRLTKNLGYDGGPFISWDSNWIVFRRDLIDSDKEKQDYQALLAEHMVRPSKLEIWIMRADGSGQKQVTNLNAASFAPFLHPDGKRIIFSTNYGDPKGREFDLYIVNRDGSGLERITYSGDFDGFPMFTRDGKQLVFASNRNGKERGETNIFVADWVD